MIGIENSEELFIAGFDGVLRAKKDQAIKHYFEWAGVGCISHISESLYLVGHNGLIVWDEQTDQELFQICEDQVCSIKRILNTNTYIIKTEENGLKLLKIKNLKR